MSVSSVLSSTPAMTASAPSDKLYSLSEVVPESVMDVAPVTQAGKDPLVAATLEDITTYNKLAYMAQHTDWDAYEAVFGAAMTEKAKAQDVAGLNKFAGNILFESSSAGIPVTSATSSGSDGSAAMPTLSVAETPIKGDTATITVKTAVDGSLTAFKDGQLWKSFTAKPITGMDANLRAGDIALQLLQAKQGRLAQFA